MYLFFFCYYLFCNTLPCRIDGGDTSSGVSNECTDSVDTGKWNSLTKPDQSARTPYTRQPCSPELFVERAESRKKDKQTDNNDQRSPTSCVADTTHGYRWCRSSIVAVRWATRPTRRGHHHRIRDSLRDCGIRMNHLVNSAERKMCPTLRTLVIVWMRVCGDWGRGHGGPRSRTVLQWILSRRWSLHIRLRG
jgi:hypothetical protein